MPDLNACPTPTQLEQFAFGNLLERDLALVAAHAESCAACQVTLTSLDQKQDALLAQLRRGTVRLHETDVGAGMSISADRIRANGESDCPAAATPAHEADTTPSESKRLRRLLVRLEQLPQRGSHVPRRDWMEWAGAVFGSRETRADQSPTDGAAVIRIGEYRLVSVLGVGGMGVVFQAQDEQLRRAVAIKVMRPERLTDANARQRFLREARAIAAIQHDHIVSVFQVGEDRDVPYFVMPLLRGCSLETRLQEQPQLELPQLLEIAIQAADGIAAAHAHGLIHRDIKPSNIWLERVEGLGLKVEGQAETASTLAPQPSTLSPQLCIKLLDFGLARASQTEMGEALSEDGIVMGTPAFMSPEQAAGTEVDHRTDLFSLGCVLYRMATGQLPFPGKSVTQQLTALMTRPLPPIQELNAAIPEALSDLGQKLLERDREQRPTSAIEVRRALQSIAVGDHTARPSRRKQLAQRRTLIAMSAVATLAVALILSVGVFWFTRTKRLAVSPYRSSRCCRSFNSMRTGTTASQSCPRLCGRMKSKRSYSGAIQGSVRRSHFTSSQIACAN
jgi:serine/threonine protein kinase